MAATRPFMSRDCNGFDPDKNGKFSRLFGNHKMNIERQVKTSTLSKRQRVKHAARKLFFAASLSSSMWLKGHGNGMSLQPPSANAILGLAKKEEAPPVETPKAGTVAKIFPVVAISGGVVLAKRKLSGDNDRGPSASSSSSRSIDLGDIPAIASAEDEKEALRKLMNQKKNAPIDENLQKQIKEREARRDARIEEDQRRTAMEVGQKATGEAERITVQVKREVEISAEDLKAEEEMKRKILEEAERKAMLRAEAAAKAELEVKKKAREEEQAKAKTDLEAQQTVKEEEEAAAKKAAAAKEAALKAKAEEEARLAKLEREEEEKILTTEMEAEAKKVREDEEQEARLAAEANAARIKAAEEKQIEKAKLKAEQEKLEMEQMDPAEKYAAIEDLGERAFQILLDLGMVEQTPDPSSPGYDSSQDDQFI